MSGSMSCDVTDCSNVVEQVTIFRNIIFACLLKETDPLYKYMIY